MQVLLRRVRAVLVKDHGHAAFFFRSAQRFLMPGRSSYKPLLTGYVPVSDHQACPITSGFGLPAKYRKVLKCTDIRRGGPYHCDQGRSKMTVTNASPAFSQVRYNMETIVIVLVVLFVLGGGGWEYRRWRA